MKHKRVINKYQWHTNHSNLPSPPPRKPELRKAVFWLCRDGDELYFVNLSNAVIDSISISCNGFGPGGDETTPNFVQYNSEYENVQPNEAVKVDEYDPILDSDFLIQNYLIIESKQLGKLQLLGPVGKGEIKSTVLLWDNGEFGKGILAHRPSAESKSEITKEDKMKRPNPILEHDKIVEKKSLNPNYAGSKEEYRDISRIWKVMAEATDEERREAEIATHGIDHVLAEDQKDIEMSEEILRNCPRARRALEESKKKRK